MESRGLSRSFGRVRSENSGAGHGQDEGRVAQNPAIVRNRLKIDAAITNAKAFPAIQRKFGSSDAYVWSFVARELIVHRWKRMTDVPAAYSVSDTLSKGLKRRGFCFVGSTIVYAYMQAVGLVNDHVTTGFPCDNQFSEGTFP